MAKSTNYRGIHISVTYAMGNDYYEISQINKGKKWNDKTLFDTLKEAKMYIDEHYDELIKNESKKSARKSIEESYKLTPFNIDKEDVKIYYDLLDKLTLVNPTDATYNLPVRWYSFLYDFCEAFEKTLKSEKKDLQKWYRETTPSSISKDDYFECDTDTIDSIYFAMEDYLNGELTESKKSARKSLKEMFNNDEGIVYDFVDFLIYDCGYDEKTVEKYFYKKYKLDGLDTIPTKLYIKIKNEIEDALGYNDIM